MAMRCYPCVGCGKCDMGKKVEFVEGECLICRHVNPASSVKCEKCRATFPLPPGKAPQKK